VDDVRVTAEYWQDGDGWHAHAYGGPVEAPVDLTVTGSDEAGMREAFIGQWNEAAGTAWDAAQFRWVTTG
jgi:hypothetical protein